MSEQATQTVASRGKVTPALKQAAKPGSFPLPGKLCNKGIIKEIGQLWELVSSLEEKEDLHFH